MKKRLLALLCTFAVAVASPVMLPADSADAAQTGKTYYISSKNGNNASSGLSQSEAWETLDMLIDLDLKPGDSVLLEAGSVFNDSYIHLKDVHGEEGAPITIGSYGKGERPVIHANGQGVWYQDYKGRMDSGSHRSKGYISSTILLYDVDFVEIRDLELTNKSDDFDYFEGAVTSVSKTNGRMGRTGVSGIAKDGGTSEHIYLDNLYIHDVDGNIEDKHINNGGIQINAIPPEDEEATGIARYDDVRITNCYVRKVSRAGICVGYTYQASRFGGAAISDEKAQTYGHTNLLMENNYIKDIGNDGIVAMYAFRPLIQNNVSDHAGADLTTYGSAGGDGAIWSGSFHQALCAGIWPWKCKDAIFQYNEVFDTVNCQDGQPWDIDSSDGTIYQYNYSHNNGGGCLMICAGEAYNGVFRYNISQNDLKAFLALPGNPNGEIYNNVFYVDGDLNTKVASSDGKADIRNNIFYNISSGRDSSEEIVKGNRTFSNNIFYGYNGTTLPDGSITEDPMFVDPGKAPTGVNLVSGDLAGLHDRSVYDGYKLRAGSPAINAGVLVQGSPKYDFFGNEVGLLPDIGAYESDTPETEAALSLGVVKGSIVLEDDRLTEVTKGVTAGELKEQLICAKGATIAVLNGNSEVSAGTAVTQEMTVRVSNGGASKSYRIELAKEYLEYDPATMTAKAGSEAGNTSDGIQVAANVLDNDLDTIWHTSWAGCTLDENWIEFDLGVEKAVAMVKYVARASGGPNGVFENYVVKVRSSESDEWKIAAEGTWQKSGVGTTEYAKFPTVNARYVRLQCTKNRVSGGSEGKNFGTAAEIRIGYEKE